VSDLLTSLTGKVFGGNNLLQEYLLDGLSEDKPFLSLHCFYALLAILKSRRFNDDSPTFKCVLEQGSPEGRLLAALLYYLVDPRSYSKRRVIRLFSSQEKKLAVPWNNYGKVNLSTLSVNGFIGFIERRRQLLANDKMTADQVLADQLFIHNP